MTSRDQASDSSDHPLKPDAETPKTGLICHRCGCCEFRVVYTRPRANGTIIRRRECRHCGCRILTVERTAGKDFL